MATPATICATMKTITNVSTVIQRKRRAIVSLLIARQMRIGITRRGAVKLTPTICTGCHAEYQHRSAT